VLSGAIKRKEDLRKEKTCCGNQPTKLVSLVFSNHMQIRRGRFLAGSSGPLISPYSVWGYSSLTGNYPFS
jgi:hypothetical protein